MIKNTDKNNIAYIGIGSNLNNPYQQVLTAVSTLSIDLNLTVLKSSKLYHTKPYGTIKQDNFINSVIKISTNYNCFTLLEVLQNIEASQDRIRTIKWGPRTIDLDILAFNNEVINTQSLTIPHMDLKNRRFVLEPWSEIDPNHILPDGSIIRELLLNLI